MKHMQGLSPDTLVGGLYQGVRTRSSQDGQGAGWHSVLRDVMQRHGQPAGSSLACTLARWTWVWSAMVGAGPGLAADVPPPSVLCVAPHAGQPHMPSSPPCCSPEAWAPQQGVGAQALPDTRETTSEPKEWRSPADNTQLLPVIDSQYHRAATAVFCEPRADSLSERWGRELPYSHRPRSRASVREEEGLGGRREGPPRTPAPGLRSTVTASLPGGATAL